MTTENTEKQKNKNRERYLILGLVILIFLIVFSLLAGRDNGYEDNLVGPSQTQQTLPQNKTLDDIDAYIQGQYYVKQGLKSPATAKFPPNVFFVHRFDDNRYEVISYVDSQNSFGAMLRSNWNVVFKYQNGKVYLERMIISGKTIYQSKDY